MLPAIYKENGINFNVTSKVDYYQMNMQSEMQVLFAFPTKINPFMSEAHEAF